MTPWTIACQAPLSVEFSQQETGVGSHPLLLGIFHSSCECKDWTGVSHISDGFFTVWATGEAHNSFIIICNILSWHKSFLCVCVYVCVCVCMGVCPRVHSQLCLTFHYLMDCSMPGSSDHGISQARILEWIAISSSRRSFWPRDWTCIFCISCIGRQILYR